MNAPMRRGMCPTLSAPIATGDGLLARLNPVAAGLSPEQLNGLCEAAQRHGNGLVEITARGSLQIRGLTAQSTVRLAVEVDALGIEVRSGVPVETGPLAGLDPDEVADARPLAERIRAGITAAGLEGRLGPKVSVVVDGGGYSGMGAVAADVRLTAVRGGADVEWQVAIAGDAKTGRAVGLYSENDASGVTLALLSQIAALGQEGRARHLDAVAPRQAIEGLRSVAPPSVLPDISPTRGEIGPSSILSPTASVGDWRNPSGRLISPLVGEMPSGNRNGRTEGGNAECNHLGRSIPLTDSRFALHVALPFGSMHAKDLAAFVEKAGQLGVHELRLAPQRTLITLCSSKSVADDALIAARGAGFVVDTADSRAQIAACAGAPACASGHIPARSLAAEIAAALPAGSGLSLHVSGCGKRCAKPGHEGLALVGTPDGIDFVIDPATGGPLLTMPKAAGCTDRMTSAAVRLAKLLTAEKQTGESEFAALQRIGAKRLAQTCIRKF